MQEKEEASFDVYLVQSPSQLLSAMEAAATKRLVKNVLVVRFTGCKNSGLHLERLISRFSWDRVIFFHGRKRHVSLFWSLPIFLIQSLSSFKGKVNALFIGDFRSDWMHFFRIIVKPETTVLLDDGDITLAIQKVYFSNNIYWPIKPGGLGFTSNIKSYVQTLIYKPFYKNANLNKPMDLFTSFEVESLRDQQVIKNSFKYLKSTSLMHSSLEDIVFYFGSKYTEATILKLDEELDFITKVVEYYKLINVNFVYVPHRDDSTEKLKKIQSEISVKIKYLGMPAELYFSQAQRLPKHISGACTSTLNNLVKMYQFETVTAFVLPFKLVPELFREDMYLSYENLRSLGITIIDFYGQKKFWI